MKNNPNEVDELFEKLNIKNIRKVAEQANNDRSKAWQDMMNACRKVDNYLEKC